LNSIPELCLFVALCAISATTINTVLRSDEATQEGQGDRHEVDDQVQWPDGGRCVSAGCSCQEPRRYRRIGL